MRTEKLSTKKQRRFSYALLTAFYFIFTLVFIRPSVASEHYQSCRQTKALIFTGGSENYSSAELDAFYEDHGIDLKAPSQEDLDWLVDFARSHQNHWTVNYFADAKKILGEDLRKRILTQVEVFQGIKIPYTLSLRSSSGSSLLYLITAKEIFQKEVITVAQTYGTESTEERKVITSKGRSFVQKARQFLTESTNSPKMSRMITKANLAVAAVDLVKTLYTAVNNRREDRDVSRFLATLRDTSCKDLSHHPEVVMTLESFRKEITPLFQEVRKEVSQNIT